MSLVLILYQIYHFYMTGRPNKHQAHRLQRCAKLKTTLADHLVFSGLQVVFHADHAGH